MASADLTHALTSVPQAPDKATEIRTVLDALDKAPGISRKLSREFRSEVVRVTREVAGQDAEKFDFGNFVSKWKPVAEQFQERQTLLRSFFMRLDECITSYADEDAEALLHVLEQKRYEWEKLRQEQNIETEEITKKIDAIQQKIFEIRGKLHASEAAESTVVHPYDQEQPPTSESSESTAEPQVDALGWETERASYSVPT